VKRDLHLPRRRALRDGKEAIAPARFVRGEQLVLGDAQLSSGLVVGPGSESTLEPDELPSGVALAVEEVGEHEPWRVVVRCSHHGREERGFTSEHGAR